MYLGMYIVPFPRQMLTRIYNTTRSSAQSREY